MINGSNICANNPELDDYDPDEVDDAIDNILGRSGGIWTGR